MNATRPFPEFEKPLSDDAGHSCTMPTRYYTDPDVYEREKQAIFARSWHYVGHESHVRDPGDYLTLQIADESVFVMRGEDGRLRGFFNVCRHRAHRLLSGAGNAATIVCPYHAWSCHSDGRLRHARFADRMQDFDPDEFRLPHPAGAGRIAERAAVREPGCAGAAARGDRGRHGRRPCRPRTPPRRAPAEGLCESVQQGLKSQSYNQGRFMVDPAHSGTAEHGVHQFHRLVTRTLASTAGPGT